MSIVQIVPPLQVANDSRDVRPVHAAVGPHGNRPARAIVATEPRSNHPAAVHVRDLAVQIGDRLNSLQNHPLQLGRATCGVGHLDSFLAPKGYTMHAALTFRALDVIADSGESCEPIFRDSPRSGEADGTDIAPCPFCHDYGAEEARSGVPNFHGGFKRSVYCNTCFAEGPPADTSEEAIALWNDRSAIAAAGVAA